MTEAEWDHCTDPMAMLEFVKDRASKRRLQLFLCAHFRMAPPSPTHAFRMQLAEVLERLADCLPGSEEAFTAMVEELNETHRRFLHDAWFVTTKGEQAEQCSLIWCIFGNPFYPLLPLAPSLLAWDAGLIVRLAQSAYENPIMPAGTLDPVRLGVLADALEDCGADADLLGHLREQGAVHVRGCHVIDLILNKEGRQ